jgi:hypothetical protein
MKIRVEVEVGADELREFLGLPDVTGLQQEALDALSRGLHRGTEGLDPVAILKSFVPASLLSLDEWQGLLRRAIESGHAATVEKTVKKTVTKKPSARKGRTRKS